MHQQIIHELSRSLKKDFRGLKNITVTMENDCNVCHGDGKIHQDNFEDFADSRHIAVPLNSKPSEIDCPKCSGSGGIEIVITCNVVKTPFKKEKKK